MDRDQGTAEGPVAYDAILGGPARTGTLSDKARSSYALAREALAAGRFDDAANLGRHTVEEAREAYELYRDWIGQIRDYLIEYGVAASMVSEGEARLAVLLRAPDGRAFDLDAGWRAYIEAIERFATLATKGDAEAATTALREAWALWLDAHDKGCDQVGGMLDLVVEHLGESHVGPLWDRLMAPMYDFYDRYDTDSAPWPISFQRILTVAIEALRGHLSGPTREGDIEITDEKDRVVLRFDPCGSGGRSMRTDPVTGERPRMEAPFGFRVTTRAHPWSWSKKGICVYCVHCCQLNMRMPIAKFGYPTRVVEPPTWPEARIGGKCSWIIYKDPRLVPDAAYEAVGEMKPSAIGSAATRARRQGRS
ncbi:MAG: hypothetical protein FJX66_05965 [Alphaproteobacteria bacterium]|nr:hypothetical protein [Alphaproteobacteria bacterium]